MSNGTAVILIFFPLGMALGFFLGLIARSIYPAVARDHIRFTTHGEHHE